MQESKVEIEFNINGVLASLRAYFSLPTFDGQDYSCILNIDGLVNGKEFYGVDATDCLVNVFNFVNSIVYPPIPLLFKILNSKADDVISVSLKY